MVFMNFMKKHGFSFTAYFSETLISERVHALPVYEHVSEQQRSA
jgi:hypothetical protein